MPFYWAMLWHLMWSAMKGETVRQVSSKLQSICVHMTRIDLWCLVREVGSRLKSQNVINQ